MTLSSLNPIVFQICCVLRLSGRKQLFSSFTCNFIQMLGFLQTEALFGDFKEAVVVRPLSLGRPP